MREKLRAYNSEVFRYLVIGVCTTLVNYVLFLIMCYLTPIGWSDGGITAANVISIGAAILFAYFANKHFVFKSETSGKVETAREMVRFVTARLGTMAIEVAGVYLLVSAAGMEPFAGKLNIPDRGNRGSRMLETNIPEYGNRSTTQLMIYQDRILHA